MNARRFILLSMVFFLTIGSIGQAAVIAIDDDFNGPAGTKPDPAIWIVTPPQWGDNPAPDAVLLDGQSNVEANGSGFQNLMSIAGTYGLVPTAAEFCRVTYENLSQSTTNQINFGVNGAQQFGPPRIQVRADVGGGFYSVDVSVGTFCWWRTDVPWSASGTWVIDWFTDKVQVYFEGALKFDSSVNTVPTSGSSSWTIPSVPLHPEIGGGFGMTAANGYFSVDRITWETLNATRIIGPSPVNNAAGVEPDVILSWDGYEPNSIPVPLYDVYFGTDPNFSGDSPASAAQAELDFDPPGELALTTDYYWRVDILDPNNGGPVVLATGQVLHFTTRNAQAHTPVPADLATEVDPDQVLSWSAGFAGATYDVYFGTNETAVANGDPSVSQGNQSETAFDPFGLDPMDWSTTYYWRIDEVEIANPSNVVIGDVWQFTTIVPVCDPPIPADTNNDCVVDLQDVAAIAGAWLQCNWVPQEACP